MKATAIAGDDIALNPGMPQDGRVEQAHDPRPCCWATRDKRGQLVYHEGTLNPMTP